MRLPLGLCLSFAVAATAPAYGCGTQLFSCEIGAKKLSLCLSDRTVIYSFGPEGAPELVLERDLLTVEYVPWAGVGRTLYESVQLENAGIAYDVWHGLDRLEENAALDGGVSVLQGEATLANLLCNPGTAMGDIDPLFDAIEAAGRCFSLDTRKWGPCAD